MVSVRTLEALKNNKLYFSTSNYYYDPFDTFINVRIKDIRTSLAELQNVDEANIAKIIQVITKEFDGVKLDDDSAFNMASQLREAVKRQQNIEGLPKLLRVGLEGQTL